MFKLKKLCLILCFLYISHITCQDQIEDNNYDYWRNHPNINRDNTVNSLIDTSDDGESLGKLFLNVFADLNSGKHDNHSCHSCNKALTYVQLFMPYAMVMRFISHIICPIVESTFTSRVCSGVIDRLSDPLVYVLQKSNLTVPEMCSTLLHPDCMTYLGLPHTRNVLWELPLPERKPFRPQHRPNGHKLKMLHLTDVHLDLLYTPGANSQCPEPLCCRQTSPGWPAGGRANHSAGYWSESRYSCDASPLLVAQAIRHISQKHRDIDFVIWTGDNPPHDIWNTTKDSVLQHILHVTNLVKQAFAGKPVFPCLGNHDTHPYNIYVPHSAKVNSEGRVSMDWLYNTLANNFWRKWIRSPSAKRTFKRGGYYSALVRKGLKVIAINNNMCHLGNVWVAYDPIDPDGQLRWMITELDDAERHGLYAIIIGHVPPEECYLSWTNNYLRIMDRYSHVIAGTYFGHSHKDEIVVYYNLNQTNNQLYPVSHGYIGSSLTTYPSLNPGYRIFTLDSWGKPLDFKMYYTNITEDNKLGPNIGPKWQFGYSAKNSYGLNSLSTKSWDQLLKQAITDDNITERYFNNYRRFSESYGGEFNLISSFNISQKRQLLLDRKVINPYYQLLPNKF